MSLKQVFCQDKQIDILQRAFATGKSAHAYIFAGAEGIGKFKTAREWGKLLLCENPVKEKKRKSEFADGCNLCQSCKLFEADSHPDFHLVYKELREFTRDGKGKTTPVDLSVDVVREFLIEKASAKPVLSHGKVFIVSEAERLNTASQNSLLKILEEPPEYCSITLLCTRLEKLLATIKSRCQIVCFAPIDEEKILDRLKQAGIKQKKAQYFARLAQGSLGAACRWTQLELADANLYETKKEMISSLATLELSESLDLAGQFQDDSRKIAITWSKLETGTSKTDINRRAAKTLIRIIISALHDAMQLTVRPEKGLINFDQKEQIKSLAGRFTPEDLAEKIVETCKTMLWVDSAVNEKLIFERLLLNLAVSDKMKV